MNAIQTITNYDADAFLRRVLFALRYNPETGDFTSAINRGPLKAGAKVGCINLGGYVQIQLDGKIYYGHRLAWLVTHRCWPSQTIDHINGVRSDNRVSNLRDVSCQVNAQNQRGPRSDNKTSGYLGVSLHSDGKWQARIRFGDSYKSLGLFSTPELARDAYVSAKRANHEGCTI